MIIREASQEHRNLIKKYKPSVSNGICVLNILNIEKY